VALALVLGTTLLSLLALEVVVRIRRGSLADFGSVHDRPLEILARGYCDHDPRVGWVLRPNAVHHGPVSIRVDANGCRHSGPDEADDPRKPILAVGDSFTFGTDVSDDHAWPAQLAASTGTRVVNGGVPAYGMDQILLRCETLVEQVDPRLVVFAIVADDIRRCEYAYRWAWKPYFELQDDRLHLKNQPVPAADRPEASHSALRSLLGYSRLADAVFLRTHDEWWLRGRGVIKAHDHGEAVAREILDELARLQERRGIPVVFVVIMARNADRELVEPVIAHARALSLAVLDIARDLQIALAADPGLALADHLSPSGNRWVAQRIEAYLTEQGLLGR
jgi:lysophospholipase L1-like esterase